MLIRAGRVGAIGRASPDAMYDPALIALVAAMATRPPRSTLHCMDQLIRGLKADAVWDELDTLRIWAADTTDNACYNWKAPTANKATFVNSPTFTPYRGVNGDGVSSYVDTNWAPASGVKFQQDNASIFVYSLTTAGATSAYGHVPSSTQVYTNLGGRNGADMFAYRVNETVNVLLSNTDATNAAAAERSGPSSTQRYKEGIAFGSPGTGASVSRSIDNLAIGRGTTFSTALIAANAAGACLGATKQLALRNRVHAYMQRVGAVA